NPLSYEIVGGSGAGHFWIDSTTGAVRVAAPLSYQNQGMYCQPGEGLQVRASNGTQTSDIAVNVSVTQVGTPPVFSPGSSYLFSVPADAGYGTAVGSVSATDPAGGTVTYGTSSTWPFSLDSSTDALSVYALSGVTEGASDSYR